MRHSRQYFLCGAKDSVIIKERNVSKSLRYEVYFIDFLPLYQSKPFFRCVRNEATYQKARVDIKQKVLNYEGPKLVEQMQSTIRNYIVKEKEEKGSFPEIPDEEDGGSRFGELRL